MEKSVIQSYKKRFLAEHPGGFFYKIPDGWAEDKEGKRYGSERPFDVFCIANSTCYAKEFKFQDGGITFNVKRAVKPHQLKGLLDANRAGAVATVVLGWRPSKGTAEKYNLLLSKVTVFEWEIDFVLSHIENGISLTDELVSGGI